MQNITFLVLLRPIFALKTKITPHWHWRWELVKDLFLRFLVLLRPIFALKTKITPHWHWRWELVQDLMWFRPENWVSAWQNTFFSVWRSPTFGQKYRLNLSEDLFFFGDHPNFDRKRLNLREERCCFQPPPLQIPGYVPDSEKKKKTCLRTTSGEDRASGLSMISVHRNKLHENKQEITNKVIKILLLNLDDFDFYLRLLGASFQHGVFLPGLDWLIDWSIFILHSRGSDGGAFILNESIFQVFRLTFDFFPRKFDACLKPPSRDDHRKAP